MRTAEDPWRTLRQRPWLTLAWRSLPDGMGAVWSHDTITIDPRLGRVERRCALMHELVHDERRIGWQWATAATMQREEAIVCSEVAARLVPIEPLRELVKARSEFEHVTEHTVAAEFDVTPSVARLALRQLAATKELLWHP